MKPRQPPGEWTGKLQIGIAWLFQRFQDRVFTATLVTVCIHLAGIWQLAVLPDTGHFSYTPGVLISSFLFLCWTYGKIDLPFLFFALCCAMSSFLLEWLGVHTGWIFGDYHYGPNLGWRFDGVPLVMGLNWLLIVLSAASAADALLQPWKRRSGAFSGRFGLGIYQITVVLLGAGLATLFDGMMEPTASALGFWTWAGDGAIPLFNYLCWFVWTACMIALAICFFRLPFQPYAARLYLIQFIFFILVRERLLLPMYH